MTLPLFTLAGFAVWTLVILAATVGVYRWHLILTKRAAINDFPADDSIGADWYRRAMRAHANCLETLPVYGALVVVSTFAGIHGRALDALAVIVLGARVCQTTVHVLVPQTRRAVSVRFTFFTVQLVAMFCIAALIAHRFDLYRSM